MQAAATEQQGPAPGVTGDSARPAGKRLPLRLLQGVTLYWIALKLAALFFGEPHADEAYYWLWGQHLSLSYLDHAPLHAWLQGAVSLVLGWSIFALRFLSIVSAAVVLLILYLWAKRLARDDWRHHFWLSAALFYSTPLMLLYTTVAIHDRVLVACVVVSLHFFAWFFTDWAEGKRDRFAALYLGALFLGLATLTKYSGALLGVGVGLAILARHDLRSLLRSPHLYLAAALSVAMQAPVLYWNLTEGFASIGFHLGGRVSPLDVAAFNPAGAVQMLLESLIVLSPVAVLGMAIFVFAPARPGFGGMLHSTARWVFLVSSAAFFLLSFTRNVLFYWNIVAYTAFFVIAAGFIRLRLLQLLQFAYGAVIGTALLVHFSIYPVLPLIGISQPQSEGLFGWDQIAAEVDAAKAEHGAEFVAAPTWGLATRAAFALHDPDVAAITPTVDAFDFWWDQAAHAGTDAIVLAEPNDGGLIAWMGRYFDSIEPVGSITPERFGRLMQTYDLFLARNFQPQDSTP